MSGSDSYNDTWPSLVQKIKGRLWFNKHSLISSEGEYREAFSAICSTYKERDGPRLLNRIRRQHGRIIEFASTIDEANNHTAPCALEPLIWQVLVTVAQESLKAERKISEVLKDTQHLNAKFPSSLSHSHLARYTNAPGVQKPLQEIFEQYMDCYGSIFPEAATAPPIYFSQLVEQFSHVEDFFRSRTSEWERAVQSAEAEEQRRAAAVMASITSSTLTSNADISPAYGTHAQFRFIRPLGEGSHGKVSEVKEVTSGECYAQKLIRVPNQGDAKAAEKVEEQVRNEVNIMRKLQHKHIALVLFYVRDPSGFSLIMSPVADTDLRQFLEACNSPSAISRDQIKQMDTWFGCIINALTYAHEEKVKHEDIKPSNILIKNGRPYLADFGSAKDFSHLDKSTTVDLAIAGTPVYWAPELTAHGRPADIFALGCVFSEMLTVRQGQRLKQYRDARYVAGVDFVYAFRKNLPAVRQWLLELPMLDDRDSLRTTLLDAILNMLQVEPDDRSTAKEIRKKFRGEEDFLFCSSC